MNYDIEADWILLDLCNYNCSYCLTPEQFKGIPITKYGSIDDWCRAFSATKKTWLLRVTGGEPTLYPEFVELCLQLSKDNLILLNSNLSTPVIDTFAEVMCPTRVPFINAAVHPIERGAKNLPKFISRVINLMNKGFLVLPSILMSPDTFSNYNTIISYFKPYGITPIPKVMRGTFNGKKYPEAYTELEKHAFLRYLSESELVWKPIFDGLPEVPTYDIFADKIFINGIPDYRGRACLVGNKFVKILPDGGVRDCTTFGSNLGNLLEGTLTLREEEHICVSSECPYYCEKYSREL